MNLPVFLGVFFFENCSLFNQALNVIIEVFESKLISQFTELLSLIYIPTASDINQQYHS